MTTFKDFSLREELTRAVADLGFETPTPIQEKVIPSLIENPTDIIGLAQTGTGKTAAFGLPLLNYIDTGARHVQALVLSPTRELCMQIQEEFKKYSAHLRDLRITAVYGGVPITGQIKEIKQHPQVIVATPGRLIDLLERKALYLDEVEYVVLDEADEMLNMGFREDIDFILKNSPARKFTWLFSATMSNDVRNIAKRFMKDWKEHSVAAANVTNENIDHQYFVTRHHNRFETLQRLLDFNPGIYGIIFTRTRQDAQEVTEKMLRKGYHAAALHGDMDQKMRSKVMERFKNKSLQIVVATDVAARGIDVNDISHVINYELPDDIEVYTHRSGRTARAGKSGICMSIITPKEIGTIRQIERLVKTQFHKSDIPDGPEVIRKHLFFHLDEIANAKPQADFAEVYQASIHEKFQDLDKDELIKKLIWLQLKDTMANYEDAEDLNAGYEKKETTRIGSDGKKWVRMFINLGSKDGFTEGSLLQFIHDMTEVEPQLIERITVKELSSFYNVRADAKDFIETALTARKFNDRKIRTEDADKGPSFKKTGGFRKEDSRPDRKRFSERSRGSYSSGGGGGRKTQYSGGDNFNRRPKRND